MRVLIVDDELAMRTMLSSAMTIAGHDAAVAESGGRALELLADEAFDVVVTDLQMIGLDGVDLMEAAACAGQHPSWVIITAEPRSARLAGLSVPVLAKPFRLPELFVLLDRASRSLRPQL